MATLIFCKAATMSWALLFFGVTDPRQKTQPICYSEKWICDVASSSANLAFAYDGMGQKRKLRASNNLRKNEGLSRMDRVAIRRFCLKNRAFAVRALGLALILGAAGAALWLAAEMKQ